MRSDPHGSGMSNPDQSGLGMLAGIIAAAWRTDCMCLGFFLGKAGAEVFGQGRYRIHAAVADGRDEGGAHDHAVRVGGDLADLVRVGHAEPDADAFGAGGVRGGHNVLGRGADRGRGRR